MQHKILSEKSKLIPEQEELTPDVDTTIRDLCAEYRAFMYVALMALHIVESFLIMIAINHDNVAKDVYL